MTWRRSAASAPRHRGCSRARPEPPSGHRSLSRAIKAMLSGEAVDLYYGASHALRRVSLTANKGEVTCILGRNGVGKTSLLRAIIGLQPIRSGRIAWEDRTISALPPHERPRAGIALVPQGREIFPRLTVLENLVTGFATLPRALRHIP